MLLRKRQQPRTRPKVGQGAIPFPSRGLQLRKGLAEMRPDEALILDNWFPATPGRVRGGHASHATGLGGPVRSLMEWAGPQSRKLFGATPSEIYDVTASGAVGAASVSSLTAGYWQHVNFTTSGGHFLACVNGADAYRNFDGSSWTTPSITGVSGANLIGITSYGSRLWFVESGSTKAWYLGTSSISGAATSFELGDKFRRGGKLQAIATVSRDGGSGTADLICFISSAGEVVAYHGTDPADTTSWGIDGRYMAAPPIGNRCTVRIDADAGLLTERGIVSLKQLMGSGWSAAERTAITGNIDQGIIDDFAIYGLNPGWEMIVHPRTRQAIVNVPTNANTATQYAMNIQTGAWCTYGRFASPLAALCWGIYNEGLFFGAANGMVYQAERGSQDNGGEIVCELKVSFQDYGAPGAVKRMQFVRPQFTAASSVRTAIKADVDYRNSTPMTTDQYPAVGSATGGLWDAGLWDSAVWGDSNTPFADWLPMNGIGTTAALHMVIRPNGTPVKLQAFDLKYEVTKGIAL
ncbi:MAG TPA: hypothetical protein VGE09_08535 [Pseudoxanthomonas sp.]